MPPSGSTSPGTRPKGRAWLMPLSPMPGGCWAWGRARVEVKCTAHQAQGRCTQKPAPCGTPFPRPPSPAQLLSSRRTFTHPRLTRPGGLSPVHPSAELQAAGWRDSSSGWASAWCLKGCFPVPWGSASSGRASRPCRQICHQLPEGQEETHRSPTPFDSGCPPRLCPAAPHRDCCTWLPSRPFNVPPAFLPAARFQGKGMRAGRRAGPACS